MDGLSDDDKEAFKSSSDIMDKLEEMQQDKTPRISSSLTLRVKNVLQCVKHFMESIKIFIQADPAISSLVIGGVNCILMVSMVGFISISGGC